MKTKTVIASITFAVSALCSASGLGQGNVVFYGAHSNSIGVAFADTNLSASAKSGIVSDLQLCLREWGQESELRLRNKQESIGYFHNADQCPHYPETLEFPDNIVSNQTGPALQVSKTLSDAYTNAFAFAAAHSNAVAAAHEYVAFVSSTNFCSVTSNEIANYYFANKAPPVVYQLSFPDITNFLHDTTFYPPSVLGFYQSDKGPAPTNLWMYVPSSSNPYGDVIEWSPWTAIWHDGRWKLCIWEDDPEYELPDGMVIKE